jgi:hypothetical protein
MFLLLFSGSARADDQLATLRKEHPRLLVLADGFAAAKKVAHDDPRAAVYLEQLQSDCEKYLTKPPLARPTTLPAGGHILEIAREAQKRITFLAAIYRITGDKRYLDRARQEMLAIAQFSDWNPPHFLDVAEMTASMALGYDWLYNDLSPDDRATIRQAIIDKGLNAGLDAYKTKAWWTKVDHNWANVCAGGLQLGALAIADEQPDIARQIMDDARETFNRPMKTFAPDGGWPEGPGYWNYATKYTVFYIAACQTALGTDLDLLKTPGLDRTGFFRIYTNGPTGKSFNFADSSDYPGPASQMFWLAKEFNHPEFAVSERDFSKKWGDVFHLLWYDGEGGNALADTNLPPDAIFRGVNVAFFRSGWDDPDAFYVGFKGGNNSENHAHLDLGTFVLDAFGQRWALDLGADSYNLYDYFGSTRWKYYRTRTEGHNTVLIDNANQDQKAAAPIVAYSSTPDRAFAVADLSAGYHQQPSHVLRGIELLNRNAVVVSDEILLDKSAEIQWNFHTPATVNIADDKHSAELTQGGRSLTLRMLSPADGSFDIIPCNPGPPQNANKGITDLIIKLPQKTDSAKFVVVMAAKDIADKQGDVPPLKDWIAAGKLEPLP